MDQTHIVSENFQYLEQIAQKEKINYLNAKPFPNIVLNNFFKDDFLSKVLKEFPDWRFFENFRDNEARDIVERNYRNR